MKIARICFYVADADKISNWLIHHLGFELIDTNRDNDTDTRIVVNSRICFVIASPLNSCSPVARYLATHPEGIGDVSFRVANLQSIVDRAARLGVPIIQPVTRQDGVQLARIAGWDDVEHTLIEYSQMSPVALNTPSQLHLIDIDHIVLNVAQGELDGAVAYYKALFDFQTQQTFKIQTPKSGLFSKALVDSTGQVQFNINEPTAANSQIQEFIDINNGAGIQHLALRSQNIVETVARMRNLGVEFLPIPKTYYTNLKEKFHRNNISITDSEFKQIIQQEILLDWDKNKPKSLLQQIFTKPILAQPTFFLEIIERSNNALGFGEGNFQALFEAVERNTIYFS